MSVDIIFKIVQSEQDTADIIDDVLFTVFSFGANREQFGYLSKAVCVFAVEGYTKIGDRAFAGVSDTDCEYNVLAVFVLFLQCGRVEFGKVL
jgi:hypothetical protein